jgi:hypothetical protein
LIPERERRLAAHVDGLVLVVEFACVVRWGASFGA